MFTTAGLIRRYILGLEYDKPFSIRQLLAFGRRGAIDRYVGRLVQSSHLKRVARGLYVKWSGKILDLSDFEIAEAKAAGFRKEIVIHGLMAAMENGLLSNDDVYDMLLERHKDIRKGERGLDDLGIFGSGLPITENESRKPANQANQNGELEVFGTSGESEGAEKGFESGGEQSEVDLTNLPGHRFEVDEWTQVRRAASGGSTKLPAVFSINGSSSSFLSINGRIYTRSICQRYFQFGDTNIGKLFRALLKLGWDGCNLLVIQTALNSLTRAEKVTVKDAGKWLPAWLYDTLLAGLNLGVVLG